MAVASVGRRRQLKGLRPGLRTLVTRDIEVITVLWDETRQAMAEHPEFFLQDATGRPAQGRWVSPAGDTPKFWYAIRTHCSLLALTHGAAH